MFSLLLNVFKCKKGRQEACTRSSPESHLHVLPGGLLSCDTADGVIFKCKQLLDKRAVFKELGWRSLILHPCLMGVMVGGGVED